MSKKVNYLAKTRPSGAFSKFDFSNIASITVSKTAPWSASTDETVVEVERRNALEITAGD